jgi:two-component system, chemotaxis family, protein-glutamate methylesterase/glutaminase
MLHVGTKRGQIPCLKFEVTPGFSSRIRCPYALHMRSWGMGMALPVSSTGRGRAVPHLIVLGSSAGGLQALSAVISGLPPDVPAALLIVQHLSPDYTSRLAEILTHQTGFPVEQAQDQTQIVAGRAYVAPPDRHLTVDQAGYIRLRGTPRVRFSRPSIDILFESAALNFGVRVIAVVLSGGGSDGSEGARLVREHGGVVIAQSTGSAEHGGMPGSVIDKGYAHYVVPLADIAERIIASISSGHG